MYIKGSPAVGVALLLLAALPASLRVLFLQKSNFENCLLGAYCASTPSLVHSLSRMVAPPGTLAPKTPVLPATGLTGGPPAPAAPIGSIHVSGPGPSDGPSAPVARPPRALLTPSAGLDDFMRLLNAAVETGIERGIGRALRSSGTPAVTAGSSRPPGPSGAFIPAPVAPLSGMLYVSCLYVQSTHDVTGMFFMVVGAYKGSKP